MKMDEKLIRLYKDIEEAYYKHQINRYGTLYPHYNNMHAELMDKYLKKPTALKTTKRLSSYKPTIYRGIKEIEISAYLKYLGTGIYKFHRSGLYGCGQYFSSDFTIAERYADKENRIISANIENNAKTITQFELYSQLFHFVKQLKLESYDENIINFITKFTDDERFYTVVASALGYDAITHDSSLYTTCVINPDILTYLCKKDEINPTEEKPIIKNTSKQIEK